MDKVKSYLPVWATFIIFALIILNIVLIYLFYNTNMFITISCLVVLGFCVYVVMFNRIDITSYEIRIVIGGLYFKTIAFEKITNCEESNNFWLGDICITYSAENVDKKLYLNPTNPDSICEAMKAYIRRD